MNMKHSDLTLGIIGLGYVGLPLAVEFGRKRNVIGSTKFWQRYFHSFYITKNGTQY